MGNVNWATLLSGGAVSFQLLAVWLCGLVGILCCMLHARPLVGRRRKLLPPGSLGLPMLGETLQFALFSTAPIGTPLPFFFLRMKRHGPIFKTHLLGRPTVVSMDPELSKFLLSNDGKLVKGYYPKIFTMILGPVLTLQGSSHRALRELANISVSATAVQKLHVETVQDHFVACLKTWRHRSSQIFEAQHDCKEWVFSYSVKLSLGLEHDHPTAVSLMRDFFILSSGYSQVPINLPGTKFHRVLKARQRILATITKVARSRNVAAQKEPNDILDILLKRGDESGEHFSGLHVSEWIFFFIVGAFENTFLLTVNILKFLSENAQVVEELKGENMAIRSAKANGEKLTWDDYLEKMPFTRSVVRETLRLGNIAPYVMKDAAEDISFKGMVIPKGWMVILNFSMVHLDPYYYPDPLRFNPWRWMDPDNEKVINNPSFLTPFGGGLRRCPGSPLAIFEAAMFIHYLVTSYKWERIVGREEKRDVVSNLTFPLMRNGLNLLVEPLD